MPRPLHSPCSILTMRSLVKLLIKVRDLAQVQVRDLAQVQVRDLAQVQDQVEQRQA